MLEIKNLTKIYKSKGGVVVKALDDVSIKFPATGLVFLLGKSGSGKSTLLNVTGGLDRPDEGEIIIKGRNSKTFSAADFDSYRNTYIGFIFQEYNILNEFNVEQNISLALQLQGKKNDKAAVDKILKDVDLEGYGKRKPNTLSGGQKQRIAIARALIKNPEIIMADEPTGALDSTTGKQVFDTLKKLSKEKLVIVVSHDRDFAEEYGDRIIELADGKILSDVTKEYLEKESVSKNVEIVTENVITIKNGKDISREEFEAIYELLKNTEGEVLITKGERELPLVKQAVHLKEDNRSTTFKTTEHVEFKEYDGKDTKFIKSRLPLPRAFKMGASSLKTKPIRMIFTILLTVVSLVMFGVASTLLLYDKNYSISTGLQESPNDYEAIYKGYDSYYTYKVYNAETLKLEEEYKSNWRNPGQGLFTASEIEQLNENTVGHIFTGALECDITIDEFSSTDHYYRLSRFTGLIDAPYEQLQRSKITLYTGREPKDKNEVAMSTYMAEAYCKSLDGNPSIESLIGKNITFYFPNYYGNGARKLKLVGLYDCGQIPSVYDALKTSRDDQLGYQFNSYIKTSYNAFLYVTPELLKDANSKTKTSIYANYLTAKDVMASYESKVDVKNQYFSFVPAELMSYYIGQLQVYDLGGNPISYVAPKNNEIYLSDREYEEYRYRDYSTFYSRIKCMVKENYFLDSLKTYIENNKEIIDEIMVRVDNNEYSDDDRAYLSENIYEPYVEEFLYHKYLTSKLLKALQEVERQNKTDEIPNFYDIIQECRNYYNNGGDQDFNTKVLAVFNDKKDYYIQKLKESDLWVLSNRIVETIDYGNEWYCTMEEAQRYIDFSRQYIDSNIYDLEKAEELLEFGRSKMSNDYKSFSNLEEEMLPFMDEPAKSTAYQLDEKYCLYGKNENAELRILGYTNFSCPIMSMDYVKQFGSFEQDTIRIEYNDTTYVPVSNGIYTYALTRTDYTEPQIKQLLQSFDTYYYGLTNSVYYTISNLASTLEAMTTGFLITGIVFAVFAALMLFNFISSSITSKIKEIGILRAIGTRGTDLFKIFFSESGIITVICLIVSIISSFIVCMLINNSLVRGLGIKVMNFGMLNMLIIIAGGIFIAFIGTFIPVFIASKKAPIESIRTL